MNSELGAIEERIRRLEKFVIGQNLDRREDDEKVYLCIIIRSSLALLFMHSLFVFWPHKNVQKLFTS